MMLPTKNVGAWYRIAVVSRDDEPMQLAAIGGWEAAVRMLASPCTAFDGGGGDVTSKPTHRSIKVPMAVCTG